MHSVPAYVNMVSRTYIFNVGKFAFLFAIFVVGEGQLKGFGRLYDWQRPVSDDQWFIQKLDHFNGADGRVWKQVYSIQILFHSLLFIVFNTHP